jgi:hypothetical protein
MKKSFLIFVSLFATIFSLKSQSDSYKNEFRCKITAQDFVKENLKYPQEAKFSNSFVYEENGYSKCIILGQVTAKNAYGTKSLYTFKIWMTHNGNEWTDIKNWELERLILEDEEKKQTIIDNRKKPVNDTRKKELGSIDGVKCTFIEGSHLFTRVVTGVKLNRDQIKKASEELDIKTDIIYFHLPDRTNRGQDYAMKNGNMIFIFED